MKKKNIDLEVFKKKYISENLTIGECASFFNCGKTTIVRFCKKHNIKKEQGLINQNNSRSSTIHNHELVKKLYFDNNLTKKQISKRLSIKESTVSKIISISKRTKTQEQKKQLLYGIDTTIEHIHNLYIKQNKSLKELGKFFNVGESCVLGTLKRYNISKPEHLRKELVIKSFVKSGKANTVNEKTVKEISSELGISITAINKFIKQNNSLSDDDTFRSIEKIAKTCQSSLEEYFSRNFDLSFLNKSNVTGYKPDFKIKDDVFVNVDGLYWHSELIKKDNRYHYNMRKKYEDNNIRILQLREDEIYLKWKIVKSIVNNITNNDINTIYARKCEIKDVKQVHAKEFLNKNHLMGSTNAKHMGLFLNNDLVSLISFKRYKNKLKVERFCSKINTRVIGGFSKLLKKIDKSGVNYIEYWVDLRYGTGNYLKQLGFVKSHDVLGWKWTDFVKTYNRMICRASKGKTERQNAEHKRLYKIYDAGQRLYVKQIAD